MIAPRGIAAGSVPVASDAAECSITVDACQPWQALLRTYAPDNQRCAQYPGGIRTCLTTAGAATWSPRCPPTEATPILSKLATLGGVAYALARTRPHSSCSDCYAALFLSKDGMRTWSRIDEDIFVKDGILSERYIGGFWLGSSGELLADVTAPRLKPGASRGVVPHPRRPQGERQSTPQRRVQGSLVCQDGWALPPPLESRGFLALFVYAAATTFGLWRSGSALDPDRAGKEWRSQESHRRRRSGSTPLARLCDLSNR
jgi:hypothetical protein